MDGMGWDGIQSAFKEGDLANNIEALKSTGRRARPHCQIPWR